MGRKGKVDIILWMEENVEGEKEEKRRSGRMVEEVENKVHGEEGEKGGGYIGRKWRTNRRRVSTPRSGVAYVRITGTLGS